MEMEKASNKLKFIKDHLGVVTGVEPKVVDYGGSDASKPKSEYFKWNGWGYKDTKLFYDRQKGYGQISGSRYSFSGSELKELQKFAEKDASMDVTGEPVAMQEKMKVDAPYVNEAFLEAVEGQYSRLSFDEGERMTHSHGHTLHEMFTVKYGKFTRFADCVIYPGSHEHVEALVREAKKQNVVLIPYGGGTNVTLALALSPEEKRMIVSVDMARMNKIKWVDKVNMLACVEAGIIGVDLERELKRRGLCMGHEPDSVEFSTLGGWIATRASGMKKNYYGNIEDIVQNIRIVTSIGTFEKKSNWPRISNGPDLFHLIMGSEGLFGIVTEAVIKVRPYAQVHEYDSVVFPSFEEGVKFMHDLVKNRVYPASVRLVDNLQFRFAIAFTGSSKGAIKLLLSKIAKFYLTTIRGYDPFKLCVATLLFEGSQSEVDYQKTHLYRIAKEHNGTRGGPENGKRGYNLTFLIAYIRDFVMSHNFIAESLETSVPWSNVLTLCDSTRKQIFESTKKYGIKSTPIVTFRVTLLYETGATVYMYFGFNIGGLSDPLGVYEKIEEEARLTMMRCGGSLSHHHGIGKLRKKLLPLVMSPCGLEILKKLKEDIDPQNIFATDNIVTVTPHKPESDEKKTAAL